MTRSIILDQSIQPLHNLHRLPNPIAGSWVNGASYSSSITANAFGTYSVARYTATATAAGAIRFGGACVDTKSLLGKKFTVACWVRASKSLAVGTTSLRIRVSNTTTEIAPATQLPTAITTYWQYMRFTNISYTGDQSSTGDWGPSFVTIASSMAIGDWIEVTKMGVYPQPAYINEHMDGSLAGWVWEGTAFASSSRGNPLPKQWAPDPYMMTGWTGGGGTFAYYLSSDVAVPVGAPFGGVIKGGTFDTRLNSNSQWAPDSKTYRKWMVEGWAIAPTGVNNSLGIGGRYGSVYANVSPSNYYGSGAPNTRYVPLVLDPNLYRSWTYFKGTVSVQTPSTEYPNFTPNLNSAGWFITGLNWRRAVAGE
jgi:hypothetical protein